jgi:Spy/CpxP family protein refolding chaperone
MTKFEKVLFGVFGACMFLALPLAQAQNSSGSDGFSQKRHPEQRIREIYSQLNLTDDQKKQLETNKQEHRAKMESARQEIKVDKEALRQDLMESQLDRPKINRIHDQIKSLQSQMEDDKLNSILAIRAILTPEQFLKFVNLMHKYKQGHEK